METVKLNDGVEIPVYGFGTYQIPADGSTYRAVREALDFGIRHIDTAAAYFNEQEVGRAIRESGIPREEIFLTSKLWLQDYGYEPAKKGIAASLRKLGLDYMDGVPISGILRAYNSLLIQPNPTFGAELNYYKSFRSAYDRAFEAGDYAKQTEAIGGAFDVNAALREAIAFETENSFQTYMD